MYALSVVLDLNKQGKSCFAFSLLVLGSLAAHRLLVFVSSKRSNRVGYISSIVGSTRASPRGSNRVPYNAETSRTSGFCAFCHLVLNLCLSCQYTFRPRAVVQAMPCSLGVTRYMLTLLSNVFCNMSG